tara:strand:+ start:4060 stop:8676 length:4617 start_codon:yes stop_codon:yes gene_type:complete
MADYDYEYEEFDATSSEDDAEQAEIERLEREYFYAEVFDVVASSDVEDARIEVERIIEEASDTYYDYTLKDLSKVVIKKNPLNPINFKNVHATYDIGAEFTRSVPSSGTNAPRYISVQAYNWYAMSDDVSYEHDAETGLVIKITKKPSSGAGWDKVTNVRDLTNYSNTFVHPPSISGGAVAPYLTISQDANHVYLEYRRDAFDQYSTSSNLGATNGLVDIQIKVEFQSSHFEKFDIKAPIGTQFRNPLFGLGYNPGNMGVSSFVQEVETCSSQTALYYSKGANVLGTGRALAGTYGILTQYKPVFDPSGSFNYVTFYQKYGSPGVYTGLETNFVHPIYVSHSDPLQLSILATADLTIISDSTSAKQEIHRLDTVLQNSTGGYWNTIAGHNELWYTNNLINAPSYNQHAYYYIGQSLTNLNDTINAISSQNHNQLFTYTVYYAENLNSCRATSSFEYVVCDEIGNPSNFITTAQDCNGSPIPASHLPGGAVYQTGVVSFISGECCDPCTLQLAASGFDADFGSTNGYIKWTTLDSLNNATGDPWGSGSLYTVTVTAASGASLTGTAAPAGGSTVTVAATVNDTAGTANRFTVSSNSQIVPGMKINSGHTFHDAATGGNAVTAYVGEVYAGNLSNNATEFYLIDNVGNSVYSQSDATPSLVFGTGNWGMFGALAPTTNANPYYELCVTDEAGCQVCTTIIIKEDDEQAGCTDSSSPNYNSSATIDDGSCILCDATSGYLQDPNSSTSQESLFDSFSSTSTSATYNSGYGSATTHNSDGVLNVSASTIASAFGYLTWDANSKFEILVYKTHNPAEPSTATGATLVQTINAGTLNNVSNAAATISNLAYGYYTLRFRYVDTNSVSTMENCWSEFHAKVKAKGCYISSNANFMGLPANVDLQEPQSSLCAVDPCCILSPLNTIGSGCELGIEFTIACDPTRIIDPLYLYFSPDGITWTLLSATTLGTVVSGTYNFGPLNSGTNHFQINGTGYYKVEATATTTTGGVCYLEEQGYFQWPITGCTDPLAYNYNSTATCDDESCAYESYDCDGQGNCYDPGTGQGAYQTPADCAEHCTAAIIPGCTDTCASNYNASATVDDGSCTYRACLDSNATNQYWSCDCDSVKLNATINDPDCCVTPCTLEETITVTTTDTTSTCTTYNADGSVYIVFNNNNAATHWNFDIYDSLGTTFITSVPTSGTSYAGSTTTSDTYSTLLSGVYTAQVTTSLGCTYTKQFTIGSTSVDLGCTDPAADNYDSTAVCDDGSCIICGCPDPNANNYNPNATTICQCDYDIDGATPCVPETAVHFIERIRGCITLKGTDWLLDYKLGRTNDCLIMDKWKLILIEYLLTQDKEGIDCLYTCADLSILNSSNPQFNAMHASIQTCSEIWIQGGPSTGINHDPNHKGAYLQSGGGTVVTSYDGYPTGWFGYVDPGQGPTVTHPLYTGAAKSNLTFVGDVIKFDLPINHPLASDLNGTIWELTAIPEGINTWNAAGGHQGCNLQKITHYTICGNYTKIDVTETTNYYEKFLNFVNKFCKDCNISIL